MKTHAYVKKYKLGTETHFSHEKFALDFAQDFMARLEVYKSTSKNWNVNTFFDVIAEMRKRWEAIDLKSIEPLPEKLWRYIKGAIFMNQLNIEFPEVAEDKEAIYSMNAKEIAEWINSELQEFGGRRNANIGTNFDRFSSFRWYDNAIKAAFEWDREYEEKMIGSLGLKPNFYYEHLEKHVRIINDYLLWVAFDELTYQLKRIAGAKAKIQFKIHREREERYNKDWDFKGFLNSKLRMFGVNPAEYVEYFEFMQLPEKNIEKVKEEDISKAYKKLSLLYHPDRHNGSHEKFIELTEAKNKCIEFIMASQQGVRMFSTL